jgi:hypothetical protein
MEGGEPIRDTLWKCHNETLCIDILNKNVFLQKQQKVKLVLSGGWHQWEGVDIRKGNKRVNMQNGRKSLPAIHPIRD